MAPGGFILIWHRAPAGRGRTGNSHEKHRCSSLRQPQQDKKDAYFAEGVRDEILTDLAKVADLKVISRTSVMQYESGTMRNLRDIAKALGTAHVVEGTVQRENDRVRVSVQLIDALTDTHLWGDRYDRELADIFALGKRAAETIVAQLTAQAFTGGESSHRRRSRPAIWWPTIFILMPTRSSAPSSTTPAANDNLFEAADCSRMRWRSTQLFPRLLPSRPRPGSYFPLWAHHTPARRELAEKALQAALRLRPASGEAHLAQAHHLYCGYLDYNRARAELLIAQRLLPNEPLVFQFLGFINRRQGHWVAATRNFLRALELDPRNTYTLQYFAVSYYYMRRYADQAAILDRALAILPNDAGLRVTRAGIALRRRADPHPLHATIDTIVADDPAAAPGLADEWFYLALCERDAAGLDRALAALTPAGYSNAGFVFPRSWCEAIAARMAGLRRGRTSRFRSRRRRGRENAA